MQVFGLLCCTAVGTVRHTCCKQLQAKYAHVSVNDKTAKKPS